MHSLLDVYVSISNGSFITVYRKSTFSSIYKNFDRFIPMSYKTGLVYTLLYRSYMICTNWQQIDNEFTKIHSFMLKNGYPTDD